MRAMQISKPFLVLSVQRLQARTFTRQHQYCSLFMTPETGQFMQNRNYSGRTPTPKCLSSVHLMSPHVTKSHRPSPSVFAYCKRLNIRGRNGLEMRLHVDALTFINTQLSIPMSLHSNHIWTVMSSTCFIFSSSITWQRWLMPLHEALLQEDYP